MASSGATLLPEDVLIQILTRLPVESLLRFRCVCKHWYTLIKTPSFISQHYHNDNNQTQLLVHHHRPRDIHADVENTSAFGFSLFPDESFTLPRNLDNPEMPKGVIDVVGPVNGSFLLVPSAGLILWNPATRELRTLPELNRNLPGYAIRRYDSWGFGLDPCTADYKVISIQYYYTEQCTHRDWINHLDTLVPTVGVYNLSTDSWILLDPESTKIPPIPLNCISAVYLNGVQYWLSSNIPKIVAFDMGNDVFREVHAPPESTLGCLTLYKDTIALISSWGSGDMPFNVWVMGLEGCWTKCFTIDHLSNLGRPLALWKNNELIVEDEFSDLVLYNVNTHESRDIGIHKIKCTLRVFNYKGSLVSVNTGNKAHRSLSVINRDIITRKGKRKSQSENYHV